MSFLHAPGLPSHDLRSDPDLPQERVTRANYEKIQLGMSQADLRLLLGRPQVQAVDLGMVQGDSYLTYLPGGSPPDKGFRKCMRQQWDSPEISIVGVFDTEGRVICRYTGEGQRRVNAIDIVWYWIWRLF
jgi:hypothetical protein